MGVTRDLAGIVERGVGDRMTGLSADVASRSILDWLGCAISGSTSDAANIAAVASAMLVRSLCISSPPNLNLLFVVRYNAEEE